MTKHAHTVHHDGRVTLSVEAIFDGWWVVESPGWPNYDKNHCYRTTVRQVRTGDNRDIQNHRGPWPTREAAEEFQYRDQLVGYWEHNLDVYADHCLGCGRWAKVLAFDDAAGWSWRVTECERCGVLDSRNTPL